jgi:hypothetical protein
LLLATNETGLLFLPPGSLGWSLDRRQEKNPRGKNWRPARLRLLCTFTKSARVKNKRGFDLISDVLPFGRLWYTKPDHAIDYAKFFSRSHDAVIRVYDAAGNVIERHEDTGDFRVF